LNLPTILDEILVKIKYSILSHLNPFREIIFIITQTFKHEKTKNLSRNSHIKYLTPIISVFYAYLFIINAKYLLAIGILFSINWGLQLSKKNETIIAKNQKLSGRVEELDKLKESLQTEIDSLVVSYEKVV